MLSDLFFDSELKCLESIADKYKIDKETLIIKAEEVMFRMINNKGYSFKGLEIRLNNYYTAYKK